MIRRSKICFNLKFCITTRLAPEPFRLKPNLSILSAIDRNGPQPHQLHRWAVGLWIKKEEKEGDVFRNQIKRRASADASSEVSSETSSEASVEESPDLIRDVNWTKEAYKISSKLIAYATAIHRSQFRVFSFSVVLFGKIGHLLRWDRSGIIFTEPFNLYEQQETLFEFLWRLNHLPDVDHGYDTTVTSVADDEAKAALPLHKFLVRDDSTPKGRVKYYITSGAIWCSESLFGRSTVEYIGYDMETTNLVYLKVFWRPDLPGIQKEGDVYSELHSAQVSHIARLGLAGDVPRTPGSVGTEPGDVQRTRTQDFGDGRSRARVEPYVHYRLVLETLGRPLTTFKSTRQLCEVIRDAIVGMWTRFTSRCCSY